VTLDATLSSDYGGAGANLQYSFDARGMATTDAGTPPDWTSWSSIATSNGSGYSPGIWQPRVAVRNMANPNAIAYASATVVSVNGDVCEVDTTSLAVNGANTCNPPPPNSNYGSDGLLSLPEAIQIVNSGGARAITTTTAARFYFPPGAAVVPLNGGNWLSFASGTQLINAPFDFAGGSMLVANAEVTGARPWTVSGGDLTLSDVVLHDHVGIAAGAPLTLQRLLGFNCPAGTPCVDAVGPNGALAVTFSTFFNAPGGALRAAPATSGGPCPTPGGFALDVRSSTFQRASPGIQYDCTAPSRVVHTTFHENLVGISYAGGSSNTLQNDVFARNATAASCGAATFTAKDYNLVFQNGMDGCAGGDTNTLSGVDPLFFIPEATDLRLRASSQARNSALDLMLDVNDVGPLNFFGAGPDRGGRETP